MKSALELTAVITGFLFLICAMIGLITPLAEVIIYGRVIHDVFIMKIFAAAGILIIIACASMFFSDIGSTD